ncbi:MAG: threonine--tRNA ligase [Candidatus Brocadia sp. AMX2]|uniref:Threonine--tRNA ligase n=1 Tax=Candidatus Brocadia sinica JPN1 TaxID=1197129 RepID=A0ABQ0JSH8_9BACT|nr:MULTISPECIES: threonine--tRNA ligase [Brocadia]KXK28166.1 MAG: threonyl-tRNA synthetase [Candidatus Brocadia sinica]MBC6931324.1 threonine--tRNA ligase [Candidatus Brocadia sp.]MBL1168671.1 threonine--tRNA ligase [Candidatus Brocadia sp. AMX1]NOG43271.1 threonine--tRNA ligase [Planctomycetota bacterium]KAA0245938.1 MAG: threonine--tRNA ligase [Candidatus Brocadia sp. AMX2]
MVKITLPDGTKKEYKENITIGEVASNIGIRLGERALAGKAGGVLVDLSYPIKEDISLSVITEDTEEGLEILRHSTAHIMAQAVSRLFPGVKLGIGPTIENGFYYDFGLQHSLSEEDLRKIEEEMAKIIREDIVFKRMELPRDVAIQKMEAIGQPFKAELIKDIEDETVSFYTQGDFVDLCRGPHIQRTSKVKAFKLLSVAGAYWRGKETNPMLQRIYGTAFFTQKEIDKYLQFLEEAEKRDHRKIGRDLDLFSFHEEGGAGLTFWHPKGARIRNIIENFWREEHFKRGYEILYSPHIAKINLWKTSGHWNFYRESMYSPIEVDGHEYILKPMNCPFAVLMYKTKLHSYRDLPLRWGELGTVYRYERSGVLHGLLRVRGFTQDDAHIFCTPEQLESEILGVIELAQFMLSSFGFQEYEIELSVRGKGEKDKYIGRDDVWDHAENALKVALDKKGLKYTRMEGEAKFYGPAIDIKVKDAIGRGWQGPTIQVDFNLPERFDVNYVGPDGFHHRVVMVHRTVLGAMERFVGCLIEHYAGDFPLWIAPIQMRILPITDAHTEYAKKLQTQLLVKNFRVECDISNAKINYKIREGTLEKIPYLLVVGDKEIESGAVSVRSRKKGNEGVMAIEDFIKTVESEIREKR